MPLPLRQELALPFPAAAPDARHHAALPVQLVDPVVRVADDIEVPFEWASHSDLDFEAPHASDFNPGSSMGLNLQLVMTMAVSQMRMTPEEALLGATVYGAHAMGLAATHGTLGAGKQADLILCGIPNWRFLSYHYGVNHVQRVIKRGVLVHNR
jgi:Amidohydrolase family